ncbi:hypothetical protein [Nocardia sp. NPDC004860]|uniref:hypothetical protein n=1 Tax=Nocardia sp. NPDC004860 TaxID=3154557 RepID=UPI0033AE5EDA
MSRRGRKATLPDTETATARGLLGDGLVVRCFAQDGSAQRDFDFSALAVTSKLQRELAVAFARRTAPGGGMTAMISFGHAFRALSRFCDYLAALPVAPGGLRDITGEHLDEFALHRRAFTDDPARELGPLKRVLRHSDEVSDGLKAKLSEPNPPRPASIGKASYSRDEFKRIAAAARGDLREAAERIRRNRAELGDYRAGNLVAPDRRLELLDFIDRHGDVPRSASGIPSPWVKRLGATAKVVGQLFPTGSDAIAAAILLAIMTGQNPSVIMNTAVAHHRADGHTGPTATAILGAHKPRRGRRAYMDIALSEVPDWISIPERPEELSARDELHTPFGLYSLMIELTTRSREIMGTDKIFIGYHAAGGADIGRGLRRINPDNWLRRWGESHRLMADETDDDGNELPLRVRMDLLRLTYLELHQKPVAHRETTLVNDYLARNRGALADYQGVVARALSEEVDKARARAVIAQLTAADLARARTDPDAVAAAHGIDTATLERLIAGELDTVMAACVDDGAGSDSTPGEGCRASFMQCLGCSCARALPRHLPIQVLVHDRLEARKSEMTPLTWVQRFALPHAQLADLLASHDDIAVADARSAGTDTDRAVVERFLNRELDLR